jgi:hypothetical protein
MRERGGLPIGMPETFEGLSVTTSAFHIVLFATAAPFELRHTFRIHPGSHSLISRFT